MAAQRSSSTLTSFSIYKSKWSISYWWQEQEQEQEQECRFEQMSTMRLIEHVHAGHNYWEPRAAPLWYSQDSSVFNIPPHWNVLISTPSLLLMLPCRITTYLGRQYRQASSLTSQTWKLQQMYADGSMTRTTSSRDDRQVIREFL